MEFKKTSKEGKGRGSHYHIAYLRAADGITSEANGHFHKLIFLQYDKEILVEGATIMRPTEEWQVEEVAGHTHGLEEITLKQEALGKEEDAVVRVKALYKIEDEFEAESLKVGKECDDFYCGDQWEEQDKKDLAAQERAALTLNELEGKIDILGGYNRQNRTDLKCFPVEEGDARVADILTQVIKVILEKNDYSIVENQVFDDEAIVGRGVFNIYISRKNNVRGEIMVENFPWDELRMGPHYKPDGSDCEHLSKVKWFSMAKIKQLWPDKADELRIDYESKGGVPETHSTTPGEQYAKSENVVETASIEPDPKFVNIGKKEYKVIECWQKEPHRTPILLNVRDDVYHNADGWETEDVKAVNKMDGFNVVYRDGEKMRVTKIADTVCLDDDYPDLPCPDFQTIPIHAKKRKGKWWGKVKLGLDAQRETNKRHSQIADILNKMVVYIRYYDDETFFSPADEENFKNKSSSPGFMAKVKSTDKIPVKEEGVKFPSEVAAYETMASQKMKELMNVSMEMLGGPSRAESGIAIAQRKQSGLVGNEFLFDNLSLGKRRLGKTLIKYIQKLYTPDRILRIIDNRNSRIPVRIAQPGAEQGDIPWKEINRDEIKALLETDDLTQYDIAVAESAYSPTARFTNFILWSEIAAKGVPVPPEVLIDLSDLPDKEKVKQAIMQMNQASQKTEAIKYVTELAKVLIKEGILPEGVLMELGLLPPPQVPQGVQGPGGPPQGGPPGPPM